MTKIIIIRNASDLIRSVAILKKIQRRLPEGLNKLMMKWGNILERDVKESARTFGKIKDSTGTLQKRGIRWEQKKSKMQGFLFIREYGVMLDSMKKHFVNVTTRRTRLLRWASRAQNSGIRRKARMVETKELKKFSIYVRPHPFITNGIRIANNKLKPMIKRFTKKMVNV